MAASARHRWVAIGRLKLRNRKGRDGSSATDPKHLFSDMAKVASERLSNRSGALEYPEADPLHQMLICDLRETDKYWIWELGYGSEETADPASLDRQTGQVGIVELGPDQVVASSSHVLISKEELDPDGGHLVLLEKVPNISLGPLKRYLDWLSRDHSLLRPMPTDSNESLVKPIVELNAFSSSTLKQVMSRGRVEEIWVEEVSQRDLDGYDEELTRLEETKTVSLKIGKRLDEDVFSELVNQVRSSLSRLFSGEREPETSTYVRINTQSDQTKTAEIDEDPWKALSDTFHHNELISGFRDKLPTAYGGISNEVVAKIEQVGRRYLSKGSDGEESEKSSDTT